MQYNKNMEKFWNDLKSGKFASMVKESAKGKTLKCSQDVYHVLKPLFAREDDVEQLYVIFLDALNQIISIEKLFSGSLTCSMVHSREIIKKVLEHKALSIMAAHNHPSGNVEPSNEDIEVTNRLARAMEAIDGKLLDHLIVGDGYTSLADEGKI